MSSDGETYYTFIHSLSLNISWFCTRGWVHPGQDANLSQGSHKDDLRVDLICMALGPGKETTALRENSSRHQRNTRTLNTERFQSARRFETRFFSQWVRLNFYSNNVPMYMFCMALMTVLQLLIPLYLHIPKCFMSLYTLCLFHPTRTHIFFLFKSF